MQPRERHCCKPFESCNERRSPRGYLKRDTVHADPEQPCPSRTPPAQLYGTGGSTAGAATPWNPDAAEGLTNQLGAKTVTHHSVTVTQAACCPHSLKKVTEIQANVSLSFASRDTVRTELRPVVWDHIFSAMQTNIESS